MQTENPVFDSMARFFTNAAGAAQAFGAEVETMIKGRFERFVADMDFVPRDEFEAVKAMAAKARDQSDRLEKRVAALEELLASSSEAVGHKESASSREAVGQKESKTNPSTSPSVETNLPKL
jgi:BMFP domain-containing protein YqiC